MKIQDLVLMIICIGIGNLGLSLGIVDYITEGNNFYIIVISMILNIYVPIFFYMKSKLYPEIKYVINKVK